MASKRSARGLFVLLPTLLAAYLIGGMGEGSTWPFVALVLVALALECLASHRFADRVDDGVTDRVTGGALEDLALGIEALRIGEYNHQVPNLGSGELGELGTSFNAMSAAIVETILALRSREDARRQRTNPSQLFPRRGFSQS